MIFSLDNRLALWLTSHENALDALAFYQMAGCFGIVGHLLTEQLNYRNQTFRVKHNFFVHTLEEEILLDLLEAMNHKRFVNLTIKSSKRDLTNTITCIPLQIFTSTRSGRRFLCAYTERNSRFTCFRLDTIKSVVSLEISQMYEDLLEKLNRNRKYLWGVSFEGTERHHLDRLTMTLKIDASTEHYILERLKHEGRGGAVTKIAENTYQYEIKVFDCNEMLPWVRTFTGRILSLKCTAKSVERRFYQDLQKMYQIYQIDENSLYDL